MSDSNSSSSDQTYPCPSPDDCEFATGDATELLEHVNSEHAGEYQREDWPDTLAGRSSRTVVEDEDDGEPDDQAGDHEK